MPQFIQVKTMLNKPRRRDTWFLDDYTINPYSGCSFNCLFCYIRGSKYGTHMEEKLGIKENALEVLEKQLATRAKKNQQGVVVLASATEPYLQFEAEQKLTRSILELLLRYKFPVHIITRSDLVTRDFDLLEKIDQEAILPAEVKQQVNRGVFITFSFSTLEDSIAKIFEPGATVPSKRVKTLESALHSRFHTGVSLMPLIPYITDTGESMEKMFEAFSDLKIKYIFPATITLFGSGTSDSKTLVLRAIEKHYPHLKQKYLKFFSESDQMPAYYQDAFYKKTRELSDKYNLKNRI